MLKHRQLMKLAGSQVLIKKPSFFIPYLVSYYCLHDFYMAFVNLTSYELFLRCLLLINVWR